MSLKYFCDKCGNEIKSPSPDRVRRILGNVMVEIMVRYNNTWNANHVCETCVVHVVNAGLPVDTNFPN